MNENKQIRACAITPLEARQRLVRQGKTIRQWAKEHKLPERTVYEVLSGHQKGHYGIAHQVAVLLGLKEEWCPNDHQ